MSDIDVDSRLNRLIRRMIEARNEGEDITHAMVAEATGLSIQAVWKRVSRLGLGQAKFKSKRPRRPRKRL